MQRSTERVLTTHTGSLPRPPYIAEAVLCISSGEPLDETIFATRLRDEVRLQVQARRTQPSW